MRRVLISVEGQTEETFVRQTLAPHLWQHEVDPTPVLVVTSVVRGGPSFRGGLGSYARAKRDIQRLLGDSDVVAVTTMYDLYGLPRDFPGYATRPARSGSDKAAHLEAALDRDIDHCRFRAYLQLHEFEALLFVDPKRTDAQFPGAGCLADLRAIRAAFGSPEEIDDGPETAPSKRLRALYPGYQKPLHGPLVTQQVGLERLRRECPHFAGWLRWLESLGREQP